jgi:hypothetical protein
MGYAGEPPSFCDPMLYGGEESVSPLPPPHLLRGKSHRYPIDRMIGGPKGFCKSREAYGPKPQTLIALTELSRLMDEHETAAIIIIQFNSIQFNSLLFMCRVNSHRANYRHSTVQIYITT